MHIKNKYPNCLRRHRKSLGLSYKQVAKILNIKNQGIISYWERGEVMPSGINLIKMVCLFKTGLPELYPEYYQQLSGQLREKIAKQRIHLANISSALRSIKR